MWFQADEQVGLNLFGGTPPARIASVVGNPNEWKSLSVCRERSVVLRKPILRSAAVFTNELLHMVTVQLKVRLVTTEALLNHVSHMLRTPGACRQGIIFSAYT